MRKATFIINSIALKALFQTERVNNYAECQIAHNRLFTIICKRQLSLYFPWVILNPVRDDLRMMAPKPVAARDGAMKEYRVFWHIMF